MQRIYFEFKDWVDMAKAASGEPSQPEHADVIEIARCGVKSGLVEFRCRRCPTWSCCNSRTRIDARASGA